MTSNQHATSETIQSTNWSGSIPIVLTLASTSLSSPTLPPPIHVLLARHTYLHTGLQAAVRRLYQFAPTTISFSSGMIRSEPEPGSSSDDDDDKEKTDQAESTSTTKTDEISKESTATTPRQLPENNTTDTATSYPICWFEDEETQTALRWHLFAGVLYDMKRKADGVGASGSTNSHSTLPWRIRLHFTAYPSTEILPLQAGTAVLHQVQGFFKNSLKQALCLLHGNSKAAMNLTKESHGRLWRAVETANFSTYHQVVCQDLPAVNEQGMSIVPVRLYVNAKPPIQRPCRDVTMSLGALLAAWLPEHFFTTGGAVIEQEVGQTEDENDEEDVDKSDSIATIPTVVCHAKDTVVCWRVGGIQPSLECSVLDLWQTLSHPDHFLYLVVLTNYL
jgi:autophagy-related protein 5